MKQKAYKYTVSTFIFNSLKEAEEQIDEWIEEGTFNKESKVFKIEEIYLPKIKLIKEIEDKGGE